MIDIHSHLLPGVDDGAKDADEALRGIRCLVESGVSHIVATPHLDASIVRKPSVFRRRQALLTGGWAWLKAASSKAFPDLKIDVGREILIDVADPDFSDPTLRIAGGPFVLIEFSRLAVPVRAAEVVERILRRGHLPIIAHPERYHFNSDRHSAVAEWRALGALVQINAAALVGRHGARIEQSAWELLEHGWVDYVASDYHARGRPCLREARTLIERHGGMVQARFLFEENPRRLLAGELPTEVPLFDVQKSRNLRRVRDLVSRIGLGDRSRGSSGS